MAKCALSTYDNPYDPFTQFREWYIFDMDKGYNSCGYLDRVAHTSDQLSEEENDAEIERAILQIIKFEPKTYKMVTMTAASE